MQKSSQNVEENIPQHPFHLVGDDEAERPQRPLVEQDVAAREESSQQRESHALLLFHHKHHHPDLTHHDERSDEEDLTTDSPDRERRREREQNRESEVDDKEGLEVVVLGANEFDGVGSERRVAVELVEEDETYFTFLPYIPEIEAASC